MSRQSLNYTSLCDAHFPQAVWGLIHESQQQLRSEIPDTKQDEDLFSGEENVFLVKDIFWKTKPELHNPDVDPRTTS